jgi:flavorubredoxin
MIVLVGILYSTHKKVIEKLALALKRGLEEQGHSVRVFADTDERLTGLGACKRLFVGSCVTSLFKARTPARLKETIGKTSGLSGKRSIAFLAGGGMGERKALVSLMNDMEKQGCYIIDQQTFSSEEDARTFGKTIQFKT